MLLLGITYYIVLLSMNYNKVQYSTIGVLRTMFRTSQDHSRLLKAIQDHSGSLRTTQDLSAPITTYQERSGPLLNIKDRSGLLWTT